MYAILIEKELQLEPSILCHHFSKDVISRTLVKFFEEKLKNSELFFQTRFVLIRIYIIDMRITNRYVKSLKNSTQFMIF